MRNASAFEALERVEDRATFLAFVHLLAQEAPSDSRRPEEWQNWTIADFLEAAAAWTDDADFGHTSNQIGTSPWRLLANFLWAGKVYE